jgi:hypothetical protein
MSIYRRIWQDYHKLTIPKSWAIHHIDGNHNNNSIENLECVSPHVHWCIHFLQGDPVALKGKFIQGASEAGKKGGAKSKGKRFGVNNTFFGRTHTDETKEKLRQHFLGKPLSKQHKLNVSLSLRGEKAPWYGKHLSDETKEKISKSRAGRRWIHDGTNRKCVPSTEIQSYLSLGWKFGFVPVSKE